MHYTLADHMILCHCHTSMHVQYRCNTCPHLPWCTGQHAADRSPTTILDQLHEYCYDLITMQACTEMVMPMCSDGQHDMFMNITWNLTAYQEDCFKQFGVRPDPYWVETAYGGKNIEAHSNIVFRCKFHHV